MQEAQAPAPSNRSDSSELAASVGEVANMAGDSEEGLVLLARKVFQRMFEVSGLRCARTWPLVCISCVAASIARPSSRALDGAMAGFCIVCFIILLAGLIHKMHHLDHDFLVSLT